MPILLVIIAALPLAMFGFGLFVGGDNDRQKGSGLLMLIAASILVGWLTISSMSDYAVETSVEATVMEIKDNGITKQVAIFDGTTIDITTTTGKIYEPGTKIRRNKFKRIYNGIDFLETRYSYEVVK